MTNTLESNIRWAEAFILMYSVTDKCSFEEVNRLKFLINYNKRRRKVYKVNNEPDSSHQSKSIRLLWALIWP